MKLAKFALAAALLAAPMALAAPEPATAQAYLASDLTGDWRGAYAGDGNALTQFELRLVQNGARISGTMVEPNNFADPRSTFLLAEMAGRVDNGHVTFTKTYVDPDSGATHSVSYMGQVSAGGRRITGQWTLETLTGQFEMVR